MGVISAAKVCRAATNLVIALLDAGESCQRASERAACFRAAEAVVFAVGMLPLDDDLRRVTLLLQDSTLTRTRRS